MAPYHTRTRLQGCHTWSALARVWDFRFVKEQGLGELKIVFKIDNQKTTEKVNDELKSLHWFVQSETH